MNTSTLLDAEKNHLAGLLEAIQRCVYFLHASSHSLSWPLQGGHLLKHKKDNDLFESLAAHDYETDYELVAAHFNALNEQQSMLFQTAQRFVQYAHQTLKVTPQSNDFSQEFDNITRLHTATAKRIGI